MCRKHLGALELQAHLTHRVVSKNNFCNFIFAENWVEFWQARLAGKGLDIELVAIYSISRSRWAILRIHSPSRNRAEKF
jgi:hypothetical protein